MRFKIPTLFTLYYDQAVFMIGIFGVGIRAKNLARAKFTGTFEGVHRIGNWIYVFGWVE